MHHLIEMFSYKCNYSTYWNKSKTECLHCNTKFEIKAGYEFAPNCGLSDDGSHHVYPYMSCPSETFNNGSFLNCQKCSSTCPMERLISECTLTSDTRCCPAEKPLLWCKKNLSATIADTVTSTKMSSTKSPVSPAVISVTPITMESSTRNMGTITQAFSNISEVSDTAVKPKLTSSYTPYAKTTVPNSAVITFYPWVVLGIFIFTILLNVALYSLLKIRKKKPGGYRDLERPVSKSLNTHVPLQHIKEKSDEELRSLVSAEIQTAPLQTVLDNLDVVEELIVLLDPETPGIKNTRHLAASCSLSFTWINYTYSMRTCKSPLLSVLEKIIAKHPDWRVGHLVDLLRKIGRNDAIAILAKLNVTAVEV